MVRKDEMAPSFDLSKPVQPGRLNPYMVLGFILVGVLLYSFISYGTETVRQKNDQYCFDNGFDYYENEMKNIGGQKAISCCKLITEGKTIFNETCNFVIYDVNETNSIFGGLINERSNTINSTA